jgi:hypothetical protein
MLLLIPLVFLLARLACASSDISTFTDTACQDSFRNFSGPNGYPNGTCTRLDRDGTFGSFEVVGLDTGCAGTLSSRRERKKRRLTIRLEVTIYEKDTTSDPCSGAAIVAEQAQCYGTSYVYYSIDECETPSGSSSASGTKTSATSGASSTSSSSSSPATTTVTATPSSTPTSSNKSNTGAIAGGIVGGVLVIALIAFGLFFYMRGKKKPSTTAELGDHTTYGNEKRVHEMHADHATQELPAGGGAGGEVLELSAVNEGRDKDGAYNMGRNAPEKTYQEPVELPVHEHSDGTPRTGLR